MESPWKSTPSHYVQYRGEECHRGWGMGIINIAQKSKNQSSMLGFLNDIALLGGYFFAEFDFISADSTGR